MNAGKNRFSFSRRLTSRSSPLISAARPGYTSAGRQRVLAEHVSGLEDDTSSGEVGHVLVAGRHDAGDDSVPADDDTSRSGNPFTGRENVGARELLELLARRHAKGIRLGLGPVGRSGSAHLRPLVTNAAARRRPRVDLSDSSEGLSSAASKMSWEGRRKRLRVVDRTHRAYAHDPRPFERDGSGRAWSRGRSGGGLAGSWISVLLTRPDQMCFGGSRSGGCRAPAQRSGARVGDRRCRLRRPMIRSSA